MAAEPSLEKHTDEDPSVNNLKEIRNLETELLAYNLMVRNMTRRIKRTRAETKLLALTFDRSRMMVDHKRILRYLRKHPDVCNVLDKEDLDFLDSDYRQQHGELSDDKEGDLYDSMVVAHPDDHGGDEKNEGKGGDETIAESSQSLTKRKRKPRRPKDPNAPKKPQNAYFRYRDHLLTRLKAEGESDTLTTDLTKKISETWKNMSAEEKQPFFDQYNREFDVYRMNYKEHMAKISEGTSTAVDAAPVDDEHLDSAPPVDHDDIAVSTTRPPEDHSNPTEGTMHEPSVPTDVGEDVEITREDMSAEESGEMAS
ncbi:hypothetical protein IWQ62_002127 [Dispira parvispora]|uniref:HMG box domain-containing protein n=1 Tax=Dispira parvispora TaxID=1520584 RepID=A0A9W8AS13_9FUNG|nr:hypothetical protein IWQ62_002127 [Dispira parvispora]